MSQSGQPAPAPAGRPPTPAPAAGPAPTPAPAAGPPRTPEPLPRTATLGRGTLGRQLVFRVTALVALVALLITTATALAAQQLLMSQLDGQLDAVTARVRNPSGSPWSADGPDSGLLRPGQPIGTLAVFYDTDGTPQEGGMLTERGAAGQRGAAVTDLPDAAVTQLADVPTDGTKSSMVLSGLGRYRVVGFKIVAGGTISGLFGGRRTAARGGRNDPSAGELGGTAVAAGDRRHRLRLPLPDCPQPPPAEPSRCDRAAGLPATAGSRRGGSCRTGATRGRQSSVGGRTRRTGHQPHAQQRRGGTRRPPGVRDQSATIRG